MGFFLGKKLGIGSSKEAHAGECPSYHHGEAQHERTTNIQNIIAPRHYSGFLCAVVVWKNEHENSESHSVVTTQKSLCLMYNLCRLWIPAAEAAAWTAESKRLFPCTI